MQSPVLLARELRWHTRQALVRAHGQALLSITLRAPLSLRRDGRFLDAFEALCARVQQCFKQEGCALTPVLCARDADGPARHYVLQDAQAGKRLAVAFEEDHPGGLLLDIDVLDAEGQPLDREGLHLQPRACVVCGARPGSPCIVGKVHSAHDTQAAFLRVVHRLALREPWPDRIGRLALRSLLYEVSISPKPGLVDRFDSGAHSDMDFYSYLDSALSLQPYFAHCARLGADIDLAADALLTALRPLGLEAEQAMLQATGGVNTHRGLIFSLGILSAAAGRLGPDCAAADLCALAGQIAAPSLQDAPGDSHGQQANRRYGVPGVRGEAALGFPSALAVLPLLNSDPSPDRAGLRALLALMVRVQDTNVLYRAGEEGLRFMQQGARALLDTEIPAGYLTDFCRQMTDRRISPGGCADLLAVAFFLHSIDTPCSALT